MARYIDADKLIKEGWMLHRTYQKDLRTSCYEAKCISDVPSADVRENVHGEWEQVVSGCAIFMRCNQCKNAISENDFFEICRKVNHGSKLLDFCPNCGADMRATK